MVLYDPQLDFTRRKLMADKDKQPKTDNVVPPRRTDEPSQPPKPLEPADEPTTPPAPLPPGHVDPPGRGGD